MGYVAMRLVGSFSSETVAAFRDACVAPGATVHTDGLRAFNSFGKAGLSHLVTVTGGGRPKRERTSPFFTLNTLIANLSTTLKATYKRFSPKHLPDYLGAFCWTTNHRRSMPAMSRSAPAWCRLPAIPCRCNTRAA